MYKVCSLFAGVGGIDLGFIETNKCEIAYANEFDKYAVETYEKNLGHKVDCRDIHDVKLEEIPEFDIMVGGFPCTSFSVAGYRKGFEDDKTGDLFFEMERIFKERKPRVIFLENVKNLVGHDKGNTFKVIKETLEANGYFIKEDILNTAEYGNIPQNRERIYIVGFRTKEERDKFEFPKPLKLTKSIYDVIKFDERQEDSYYYNNSKYYDTLKETMKNQDTVYQWRRIYCRENKNKLCPTLTANMGTGGHNVPLIRDNYDIRKLTPKECLLFQGFPMDYKIPKNMSNSHIYKQAGNAVSVPVIQRIAENILKVLDESNSNG